MYIYLRYGFAIPAEPYDIPPGKQNFKILCLVYAWDLNCLSL